MKTIRVVAAVIADDLDHPTKILATERGYGEFKGQWEFPGGKIEKAKHLKKRFAGKFGKNSKWK